MRSSPSRYSDRDHLLGGNYVTSGAGSGVIISSDGLIITNNHVVSGANTIKVTLKDGTQYDAKLIGTDPDSDIAVIKIEATGIFGALSSATATSSRSAMRLWRSATRSASSAAPSRTAS